MEKTNTILDREKLSSDYIHSKQNFGKVIAGYQKLKPPVWKKNIFYGTIGVAAIALVVSVVNLSSSSSSINDDQKLTNNIEIASVSSNSNKLPEDISEKELVLAVLDNNSTNDVVIEEKSLASIPKVEKNTSVNSTIETVEEESIIEEKKYAINAPRYKHINNLPNLSGVFTGEISVFEFCSSKGIECNNNDYAVVSYVIQYYSGGGRDSEDMDVKGNQIPASICEKLFLNNIDNTINFTNIKAEHRVSGQVISLSSMSLKPTIN